MTDRFYSIFRRTPGDNWGQKATLKEAEEAARKQAELSPCIEYFVMKTIVKYSSGKLPIIRTEIEPEERP